MYIHMYAMKVVSKVCYYGDGVCCYVTVCYYGDNYCTVVARDEGEV